MRIKFDETSQQFIPDIESKFSKIDPSDDGKIDNLILFQDVNILNKPYMDVFNNAEMTFQGKLDPKSTTIPSHEDVDKARQVLIDNGVDFYGAWLFNLWENRIIAIQKELDELPRDILISYSYMSDTGFEIV